MTDTSRDTDQTASLKASGLSAPPPRRLWSAPHLEVIDLADETEGGAAPKNNENPNFYVS